MTRSTNSNKTRAKIRLLTKKRENVTQSWCRLVDDGRTNATIKCWQVKKMNLIPHRVAFPWRFHRIRQLNNTTQPHTLNTTRFPGLFFAIQDLIFKWFYCWCWITGFSMNSFLWIFSAQPKVRLADVELICADDHATSTQLDSRDISLSSHDYRTSSD
jgi:hypothetical protein